jgi:hypothetical protein
MNAIIMAAMKDRGFFGAVFFIFLLGFLFTPILRDTN